MKYTLHILIIIFTCISCFSDIQDDTLEGNIFDEDFSGEIVTNVEITTRTSYYDICYVDVSFNLTDEAIESFKASHITANRELGWITVVIDGRLKKTYYYDDTVPQLKYPVQFKNIIVPSSEEMVALEFYVKRKHFEDPEDRTTLIQSFELKCDD